MDYILGVDGGGTKTLARITNLRGEILSENKAGSSNFKKCKRIEDAGANIDSAVLGAIKKLDSTGKVYFVSSCFGIAGVDCEKDLDIYKKMIFQGKLSKYLDLSRADICNDSKISLVAGSANKNRIIINCGTGSICLGENAESKEIIVGGWDYILGDQGSAYDIGVKALRGIMKAYDGREDETLLSKTITKYLNIENIQDLLDWTYNSNFSKDKVASLAKVVCRTAEIGDKLSKKILKEESEEAFLIVDTVINKLSLNNRKFDLIIAGHVFKCEKFFKNIFISNIENKFDKVKIINLTVEPVKGAIKIALKNLK